MTTFLARDKVPEFVVFTYLLRIMTEYGLSDVRRVLVEDREVAWPRVGKP